MAVRIIYLSSIKSRRIQRMYNGLMIAGKETKSDRNTKFVCQYVVLAKLFKRHHAKQSLVDTQACKCPMALLSLAPLHRSCVCVCMCLEVALRRLTK